MFSTNISTAQTAGDRIGLLQAIACVVGQVLNKFCEVTTLIHTVYYTSLTKLKYKQLALNSQECQNKQLMTLGLHRIELKAIQNRVHFVQILRLLVGQCPGNNLVKSAARLGKAPAIGDFGAIIQRPDDSVVECGVTFCSAGWGVGCEFLVKIFKFLLGIG